VTSMNREPVHSRRRDETVVRFPFWKLSGLLFLLLIGSLFVYRLSESGGKACRQACLAAAAISFFTALIGLIPIYKAWGREQFWVLLSVFLSSVTRLLIGFLGVVIIILFTDLHRMQFVGFLGLFYVAFLATDTWLALWVLRNTKIDKDENRETVVHGNIWDIISRHRKPA